MGTGLITKIFVTIVALFITVMFKVYLPEFVIIPPVIFSIYICKNIVTTEFVSKILEIFRKH